MSGRLCGTKIITTLGPATDRNNNPGEVIAMGTNVVRMSSSHGLPEDHRMRADRVREIAARLGRRTAILGNPQGPKIHVPTSKEDRVFLNIGNEFLLDANLGKGESDKGKAGIDYKDLPADAVSGDILLLDDGRVQLKVLKVQGVRVLTEVIVGGPLSNNEGTNRLDGGLSVEALTGKDRADIKIVALIGADCPTVSSPRYGEDPNYIHRLVHDAGCDAKIVAEVERAGAVYSQDAVDDIILASNVVMVACGDLGVEIGNLELVGIQEALIRCTRQPDRTAITVTQMTEPVITNPVSTRTEVMDVVNAVLDGTDTVILSAETTAGQYPSEAVVVMARICLDAGKIPSINVSKHRLDVQFDNVEETIAISAMYAANHLKGATATITMIKSGCTVPTISHISSDLPILVMSRHGHTLNLTIPYRGVMPVYFDSANDGMIAVSEVANLLRDRGYLVSGDLVIVTQGDVMSIVGFTNTVRILTVE